MTAPTFAIHNTERIVIKTTLYRDFTTTEFEILGETGEPVGTVRLFSAEKLPIEFRPTEMASVAK